LTDTGYRVETRYCRIYTELNAAWAIARKDFKIYYLKPNILVSGALFPLFMFLAFVVGNPASPSGMIPGLIAITILFAASTIEPVSVPIERRVKTFDRLLAAPVSLHAVVLGESLSGFLFSIFISIIPITAGILVFSTHIGIIILLATGVMLTSLCFATMGTLCAAYPTESPGDTISMLNLVRLPLIFISGIFIPIDSIPSVGKILVFCSPLTYGNDLIQTAFTLNPKFNPFFDILMICAFIIIFQVAATRLFETGND